MFKTIKYFGLFSIIFFIISCAEFRLFPNYQLSGTYYNLGYMTKDDLINGYFHQSVEQMETSPYTYQGQYYDETGVALNSPFMQGVNSGFGRIYVN